MRKFVRSSRPRQSVAAGAVAAPLLCAVSALAEAQPSESEPRPPAAVAAPVMQAPKPAAEGTTTAPPATPAADKVVPDPEDAGAWSDFVTLSGYVEAYYAYNFARPQNKIINNRWLDERSNDFKLQTLALDLAAEKGPLSAKVTLMFGPTADRWYFEGARIPDSETGAYVSAGTYTNETWKHIQNAYAAYRAPIGEGLLIQGGLMPTQVGFEAAAIKDNWNWSRSNLFSFLPFFHVGLRLSYPVTDALTVTAAVYNGWNQASDTNSAKTLSLQASLVEDTWLLNLLYLGGIERPSDDPAGEPWRNLFDAVVQYDVLPMLSLAANVDGGYEKTDLGTDAWVAGAVYARFKATSWLYLAARGDGIYERVAERGGESAALFFGGGDHLLSGTFTAEVRPIEGISFRVEYRHDDSDPDVPMFYKRGFTSTVDGMRVQRTSRAQNTLTLGMTGWF